MLMQIPDLTKDWLIHSPIGFVNYLAHVFFDTQQANRELLLQDPLVLEIQKDLLNWDEEIVKQHNKPQLLLHRLSLLADLGIKADDPGMDTIIEKILTRINEQGVIESLIDIPIRFGGDGHPKLDWVICDFPFIVYALLRMGVKHPLTHLSLHYLESLVDQDAYHCVSSIPGFKGPGPKKSICPLANLAAAKALSEDSETIKGEAAKKAVKALLYHWEVQKEKKFFLFGVGKNYKKLKFPFVWYNILHTLEAVSRYPEFHNDSHFVQMIDLVLSKTDDSLRFKPESIYLIYKNHDFANKKEFSPTLTLFVLKILRRLKMV
ncbi:MAG: hypothetical protein MJB14_20095 [Spirochaetes bacterium]|nr:hypothetical protein [Spirochaetota bacterium]